MEERWYKLDNAAKIYPAIREDGWAAIYRIDAILKNEINPKSLQSALLLTYKRFPTFSVHISKGLFWYYFEPNESEPEVMPENDYPASPFYNENDKGYLYRVLYYKRRISLEVFHSISDGHGALVFLKTLLFNYLMIVEGKEPIGDPVELDRFGILYYKDLPSYEEIEDSFNRYALKGANLKLRENTAFKIPGTRINDGSVRVTHILMSTKALHKLAKENDATITVFLTSLFIYSILSSPIYFESEERPVKISVPINLRSRFPSKTLRNFSSYINVEVFPKIDNRNIEFNEICSSVKSQLLDGMAAGKLLGKFSGNVNAEKNLIMRGTPLLLKNVALKTSFALFGERITTSTLSNVGNVALPENMAGLVERFDCVIGAPKQNALNCAVVSFEDTISISFTGIITENIVLKAFVGYLTANGIDVSLETNY